MDVSEVMSRKIVTVFPETTITVLWRTIFKKHINAVPVVDKKRKLLGIITREDILTPLYPDYKEVINDFASANLFEELENILQEKATMSAKDLMCKHVVFTRDDTPIMRALSRMIARRLNQLPVLSKNDVVIGMITKGDIFYALFKKHIRLQQKQVKHTRLKKK